MRWRFKVVRYIYNCKLVPIILRVSFINRTVLKLDFVNSFYDFSSFSSNPSFVYNKDEKIQLSRQIEQNQINENKKTCKNKIEK